MTAAVVIFAVGVPEEDMAGKQDSAFRKRDWGVPEDVVGKEFGAGCNRDYVVPVKDVVGK